MWPIRAKCNISTSSLSKVINIARHQCFFSSTSSHLASTPEQPRLGMCGRSAQFFGRMQPDTQERLNTVSMHYIFKRYFSLGDNNTRDRIAKSRASNSPSKSVVVSARNTVTNELCLDNKDWETVYRLDYIKLAQVIQRMKIYQTGFTCCIALPGSLGCFLYGAVPYDLISFTIASSMLASVMLYIMGRFCSRLIGMIYVSKSDNSLVRIAHLNFWGKREDQIFPKDDFTPFSELSDNVSDIYINVRFYSEPETVLHLCVRYGRVFNKHEFEQIFGSHAGLEIVDIQDKEKRNKT